MHLKPKARQQSCRKATKSSTTLPKSSIATSPSPSSTTSPSSAVSKQTTQRNAPAAVASKAPTPPRPPSQIETEFTCSKASPPVDCAPSATRKRSTTSAALWRMTWIQQSSLPCEETSSSTVQMWWNVWFPRWATHASS